MLEASGVEKPSQARSITVEREEDGRSRPEAAVTGSGHKQGYLQSHACGLTSSDFKCRTNGPSPGTASQKTRTMPAVSTTCRRTGSGTVLMVL